MNQSRKNVLRNLLVLPIISLLVLSPVFASADSNKNKEAKEAREKIRQEYKENKKKIKEEAKNLKEEIGDDNLCGKYFNRFFTYGWLKWSPWTNGQTINPDDFEEWVKSGCNPRPRQATSTDTTAPVISQIDTIAFKTLALVSWQTDENSNSVIYYSTSSPINLASATKIQKNALTKNHWLLILNLNPDTTYYAVVASKDKSGNTATSSQFSWNTGTSPAPTPDIIKPIISSVSSVAGTSTATVTWSTNENATSKVYYGTSTPVTTAANFVSNSSLLTNHSMALSGLSSSTIYYFFVESSDAASNTATSSQFSFTTASGI